MTALQIHVEKDLAHPQLSLLLLGSSTNPSLAWVPAPSPTLSPSFGYAPTSQGHSGP